MGPMPVVAMQPRCESITSLMRVFEVSAAHKSPEARDLHLNTTLRIPHDEPPRMLSYDKRSDACMGDRCYGQAAMGWTPQTAACARGARIGVISSGIDAGHSVFADTAFSHQDFTPYNAGRTSHWHGTALVALLAGHPSGGVGALSPKPRSLWRMSFLPTHREGQPPMLSRY